MRTYHSVRSSAAIAVLITAGAPLYFSALAPHVRHPLRTQFAGAQAADCAGCVEELYKNPDVQGNPGGTLVTAQRAEVLTFNPVTALDSPSKDIIGLLHSDLIHVNRRTLRTGEGVARTWTMSPDGREYTMFLRRGLRFSDGHPMNADDVVFTFNVHLDPNTRSSQRNFLVIHGKPVSLSRIDSHTVRFRLAAPYAAAERLFDGIAILPMHRLRAAYKAGNLQSTWGLDAKPGNVVGLGPFFLKEYVPGQRVVLARNPYYWKVDRAGRRLPYLDEIVVLFIPSEDAQAIRFQSGELHVINSLTAENYLTLEQRSASKNIRVYDAGPGLEYSFLVFNLNTSSSRTGEPNAPKQVWFRQPLFRRAISAALDRESMVRIVYRGLGRPLWGNVTEANRYWINRNLPQGRRSLTAARQMLKQAAFTWRDGNLVDARGAAVQFSILVNAQNLKRVQLATIIQNDLRELGMQVSVVSMEQRAMLDRVLNRQDYEAAVMALESTDADPNSEMNIWLSAGNLHLWNLQGRADTPWEQEIDRLMKLQMVSMSYPDRKRLYDRVQELVAEHLPIICMTNPHVLTAATERLANFQPVILRHYTLWNADSLFFRGKVDRRQ